MLGVLFVGTVRGALWLLSPRLLADGLQWTLHKSCKLCRELALIKQVVCKDPTVQTVTSWQQMPWVQVQAGNRASKTRRYLQWWDNQLEQ